MKALLKKHAQRDVPYFIKTAACLAIFLASQAFFYATCRELRDHYLILLAPSYAATIPFLIRLAVSIFLAIMASGVIAVLIRPWWIAWCAWLAQAILLLLFLDFHIAAFIAAVLCLAIMSAFMGYVMKQMKNQIHFSSHPLSDMKLLLLMSMVAIVSVSFGLGYSIDANKRHFALPPEVKQAATVSMTSYMRTTIEAQGKQQNIPQKQIAGAVAGAGVQAKKTIDDIDKGLASNQAMLPYLFAVILFMILQSILLIFGFIPLLLVKLLFSLLKITRFANEDVAMEEVRHLTLKTIQPHKTKS